VFGLWRFAIGQSLDGWLVLFFTNDDQSDEEILARGRSNAERARVDPATVRVVHHEIANAEEKALLKHWMQLTLARMESGRHPFGPENEPGDEQ
jgi:hypothetical protein